MDEGVVGVVGSQVIFGAPFVTEIDTEFTVVDGEPSAEVVRAVGNNEPLLPEIVILLEREINAGVRSALQTITQYDEVLSIVVDNGEMIVVYR